MIKPKNGQRATKSKNTDLSGSDKLIADARSMVKRVQEKVNLLRGMSLRAEATLKECQASELRAEAQREEAWDRLNKLTAEWHKDNDIEPYRG